MRLCEFDLEVGIVPFDDSDLAQAERLLPLTPTERVERHQRLARQLRQARDDA